MISVAVHGAAGRMGATACRAVAGAPDLALSGAVDPVAAGRYLGEIVPGADAELVVSSSLDEVASRAGSLPDVVVDFSHAAVAVAALEWCASHGVHAVSGTTGIGEVDLGRLESLYAPPSTAHAVLAANFSISAALLLRFAEIAAVHFDGVEIVELHHDGKRDAPSGTALETARRVADARRLSGMSAHPEATVHEPITGARGAVAEGGIHLHAVRLPGLVAHEEVIFGATGQSLTIRQDSYDRSSFMPGLLCAVRRVAELPGLTLGLDSVLGI